MGQFYQNESPTSCNPEVYYHIMQTCGVEQNDTVAHPFSWQFTDSKAGSGPDLGGVVQASDLGEGPAFVVVGVLLEQATFQD